jgi:hypothetical protein
MAVSSSVRVIAMGISGINIRSSSRKENFTCNIDWCECGDEKKRVCL